MLRTDGWSSLDPTRYGKFIFAGAVLVNALPTLLFRFFPSVDGAAHLYNARLIHSLLTGADPGLALFYSFTGFPVPNWIGHFLLALPLTMLPAFLAEKIPLILYLVGFPYAFRSLIKTIRPASVDLSFFILPFCHSFLFALGFYNFCLALVIMLLVLALWVRKQDEPLVVSTLLKLSLLLALLYFSHIFVFGLTLVILGLYTLVHELPAWPDRSTPLKQRLGDVLRRLIALTGASALPLALAMIYFQRMPQSPFVSFVEKRELLEWLYTLRPIIAYNMEVEMPATRLIFLVIAALVVVPVLIALAQRLFNYGRVVQGGPARKRALLAWAATCLVLLALYLLLPDSTGLAGYMSMRLALLLLIFTLVAISLLNIPKWFMWMSIVCLLYGNFRLTKYYLSVADHQNGIARNCEQAGDHVPPGSVVYTLDRSNNWLASHYSNYLGINKPMVILENYEAGTGYFPLRWNRDSIPQLMLGATPVTLTLEGSTIDTKGRPERIIDHVFLLKDRYRNADEGAGDLPEVINTHYQPIYENEDCVVYRLIGDHSGMDRTSQRGIQMDRDT